jgi:hypothetical protein
MEHSKENVGQNVCEVAGVIDIEADMNYDQPCKDVQRETGGVKGGRKRKMNERN